MIEDLSTQNDVSVTQIKLNFYRIVENENWWNVEIFIANLTSTLQESSSSTTVQLTKKGNRAFYNDLKSRPDLRKVNLGINILVIGGNKKGKPKSLNPALININEDGSVGYETCDIGPKIKSKERLDPVGGFLDDHFVICGGFDSDKKPIPMKSDCEIIGKTESKVINMTAKGRQFASSLRLNASTMWIVGGRDEGYDLKSSEFITVDGSTPGINLPFTVLGHCVIQYKANALLLIGGDQNEYWNKNTWIIDPTNGFNLTKGPRLNQGRTYHSCGKMKDKYGNILIVVAGGNSLNSVEILNTKSMNTWIEGPKLPFDIESSSMVSTDDKVFLVGGESSNYAGNKNSVFELKSNLLEWKKIGVPIKELRYGHIAFIATKKGLEIFSGMKIIECTT